MPSNAIDMAAEILSLSRRRITALCPHLLQAIYHLVDAPIDIPVEMHTNGTQLIYCPDLIIQLFQKDHDAPARALLHITAHCLLGHLACRQVENTQLFDYAADIKVNLMLKDLCPTLALPHSVEYPRQNYPLPSFYQTLQQHDITPTARQQKQVAVDDHDLWNISSSDWLDVQHALYDALAQAGLLSRNDGFGDQPGSWVSDLRASLNLPTRDYRQLLSQFFDTAVTERLNWEEIDPMWYHFGLEHLDDIPIIEPSEEGLICNFGTLVIAMDTSGSCEAEICEEFLAELSSLMSTLMSMGAEGEIVLVQCDTELHRETHITDLSQWPTIAADFAPEGFGGTDFIPVFQLAESLPDVRGLIYLTDGCGEYPTQQPPFPTLFLLTDEDDCPFDMPDWITRTQYKTII